MARRPLAHLAALGLLSACGPNGELTASPNRLVWEQIDFAGYPDDLPDEGYEAQQVILKNTGKARLDLVISDFDFDRLCLLGFSENPVALPALNEGQSYTMTVGVCGYSAETGERDTLVRGTIELDDSDLAEPFSLAFQFTPVVDLAGGDDTGI